MIPKSSAAMVPRQDSWMRDLCRIHRKDGSVLSPDIAEAVKLTENIFRSVNIALMNELKVVYECMGISIWEVIEAAKTKPFGFMPFYPGPGLGGHGSQSILST